MWNDLLFSVNTIVPIILIISVGYIARIIGLIGPEGIKQGNRLVFYIFLPLLLFYNTKDAQIDLSADLTTIVYAVVTVTLGFCDFVPARAPDCKGPQLRGRGHPGHRARQLRYFRYPAGDADLSRQRYLRRGGHRNLCDSDFQRPFHRRAHFVRRRQNVRMEDRQGNI